METLIKREKFISGNSKFTKLELKFREAHLLALGRKTYRGWQYRTLTLWWFKPQLLIRWWLEYLWILGVRLISFLKTHLIKYRLTDWVACITLLLPFLDLQVIKFSLWNKFLSPFLWERIGTSSANIHYYFLYSKCSLCLQYYPRAAGDKCFSGRDVFVPLEDKVSGGGSSRGSSRRSMLCSKLLCRNGPGRLEESSIEF